MAITFKKGNAVTALLDGEIDTLIHVCNNKGIMGSGIALEIKNRIPKAYEAYKNHICALGHVSIGSGVENMVAQDGYGKGTKHLNYGALAQCLMNVSMGDGLTIGLPYKMGADRAGGNWEVVLEMVEYFLKAFDVVIYHLEDL